MKLNKIKTGIATLTAVATIFGYSMLARAEDKKFIEFESVGAQVEVTSRQGPDSNVTSIKEIIDLNMKKNDFNINIQGSHADHFGKIDGKKARGNDETIKLEVGKKMSEDLYLSGRLEVKDDVDPIREFGNKNVASFGLGVNGEYIIKKPVTIIGDVKGSALTNGDKDYSTNLGLRYYLGDKDWIDVKGTHWRESIKDTNTTMGYVSGNHEFNKKLSGKAYVGVGKESGKSDETAVNAGAGLSYKLSEKVKVNVGYDYNQGKSKNHTVGVGLTWRF
ncbi:porin family protein [Candidatus Woesearchaeota archaeon]|nr:porin family protein [Candidatus Woesearchaeota archaeon]